MTPQLPLPPAALVTVTINGVEDVAGHAVPVTTSSFTTGNAPDITAPSIVATSITYGDTSVPVNSVFEWSYSEPIDAASVLTQQNVLYDYTAGQYVLGGTLSVSEDARTVTYVPPANLVSGRQYSVNLGSVADLAGNVGGALSLFFTAAATSDVTAPQVVATNPASGATGVPLNTRVRLAFDEPISAASLQGINILVSESPLPVASRTLSNGDRVVTINLTTLLAPNTFHRISAIVKDRAGNEMGAPVTSTFTTGSGVDLINPATTATPSPAAGATGVPVGTAPTVTFSEAIDPTSVIYGGTSGVTLLIAVHESIGAGGLQLLGRPPDGHHDAGFAAVSGHTVSDSGVDDDDRCGRECLPDDGAVPVHNAALSRERRASLSRLERNGIQRPDESASSRLRASAARASRAPSGRSARNVR